VRVWVSHEQAENTLAGTCKKEKGQRGSLVEQRQLFLRWCDLLSWRLSAVSGAVNKGCRGIDHLYDTVCSKR